MRYHQKLLGSVLLSSLFLLTPFLFAEPQPATKPPKGEQYEKLKEALGKEKEKTEALKKHEEMGKQIDQIFRQQQFVLEHQKRLQDMLDRMDFATAVSVLSKNTYETGEGIDVEFVLTNRSKRPFLVDGRKFYPTYVVRDESGHTVLTVAKEQKRIMPEEKDLIRLDRNEKFIPLKIEPFSLSKPGKYEVWGEYEFAQPLQEVPHVWVGKVRTYVAHFQVIPKKPKK